MRVKFNVLHIIHRKHVFQLWQSNWPASFSLVGLILWPNWLERWLATLSIISTQVRIPAGLLVPGRYTGGSSAGLGKARRIDSSLRADWLSCFFLAWWEWWVARQGCLVPLRNGEMWQSSWPASFSLVGLTLWPNWLQGWLATLSVLSIQVQIPGPNTWHIDENKQTTKQKKQQQQQQQKQQQKQNKTPQ